MAENKNNNDFLLLLGAIVAYFVFNNKSTAPTTNTTVNTNIKTFANGFTYNISDKCLYDKNGNLIGDGVTKYDDTDNIIIYDNGYTLNLTTGVLINNNNTPITQNYNIQKTQSETKDYFKNTTFFTPSKKIYGYSSIDNIYFYIENDFTPFSILDGIWLNIEKSVFAGNYIGNYVPVGYYTNSKVYNAVKNPLINLKSSAYIEAIQTQYNNNNMAFTFTFDIIPNPLEYNILSLRYPNVFYNSSGIFCGAGVVNYDKIKNIIYFDDNYYLDFKNKILYDKNNKQVGTNVSNYISLNAWNSVGIDMRNKGTSAAYSQADGVPISPGAYQINFTDNYIKKGIV